MEDNKLLMEEILSRFAKKIGKSVDELTPDELKKINTMLKITNNPSNAVIKAAQQILAYDIKRGESDYQQFKIGQVQQVKDEIKKGNGKKKT